MVPEGFFMVLRGGSPWSRGGFSLVLGGSPWSGGVLLGPGGVLLCPGGGGSPWSWGGGLRRPPCEQNE